MQKKILSVQAADAKRDMKLFYTCFAALVTTAFGFILRAIVLPQWGREFDLTQTQLGEITGVGLWPFAISIVVFSLIIDKIGYKTALFFAFVCHVASAVITMLADGYGMLYAGTFIVALGNGIVEAVVNPVVATMFSNDKTKWLNILHAAWPGGLVLGGIIALVMGPDIAWEYKIGLIFLPVIGYGILMLTTTFPVNERVEAGVSYKEMLQEVGALGALIILALITWQLGSVFSWSAPLRVGIIVAGTILFAWYAKSAGHPLFILLLLIMIPLATAELGTDSWITDLMSPVMNNLGIQAGWVLVYTSAIMFILRFFAGPIVHKVSALGLLAICSAIAAVGLYMLSASTGIFILVAATIYGLGKTFFWPTMLGVVSERFPKGGALTLNLTGGMGMIAAGVIGAGVLGFVQDKVIDKNIAAYDKIHGTYIHSNYLTKDQASFFGDYSAIDQKKLDKAHPGDMAVIKTIQDDAKKEALGVIVVFPLIMFVSYVALIFYFRAKGGYHAVVLKNYQ